jgi:hypothetical protein
LGMFLLLPRYFFWFQNIVSMWLSY